MLEDINEAIKKNLPAQVGDQLKILLREGEGHKADVERLRRDYDAQQKILVAEKEKTASLEAKLKLAGELDAREKAVLQRENKLEVTLAQTECFGAVRRADEMKELVSLIFRNPRIVKTVLSSTQVPVPVSGNNYPVQATQTENKTVTKEMNPQ